MNNNLAHLRDSVSRAMVPALWCHVALAAGIAAVATAAWLVAPSSAATRLTIAVALIGMVSIILAARRGSFMQLDVHMYYFASLAVLAAYCDRNVIIAGALTTALHHIGLNLRSRLDFSGRCGFRQGAATCRNPGDRGGRADLDDAADRSAFRYFFETSCRSSGSLRDCGAAQGERSGGARYYGLRTNP